MENSPSIIKFGRHCNGRGDLTFADGCIPFEIKRVFYMENVPVDSQRGGHAHRTGEQVLVAIKGGFKVSVLANGVDSSKYALHDSGQGLYIPAMTWIELHSFTPGAICLVLASDHYDEADHIRDYNEFLKEALGEGFLLH